MNSLFQTLAGQPPAPASAEKIDPALLTHKIRLHTARHIDGENYKPGTELLLTEGHFAAHCQFCELLDAPETSRYHGLIAQPLPRTNAADHKVKLVQSGTIDRVKHKAGAELMLTRDQVSQNSEFLDVLEIPPGSPHGGLIRNHTVKLHTACSVNGERHPAGKELLVTESFVGGHSRLCDLLSAPSGSRYFGLIKNPLPKPADKEQPAPLDHKLKVHTAHCIDGEWMRPGAEIMGTAGHYAAHSRFVDLIECPASSRFASLVIAKK